MHTTSASLLMRLKQPGQPEAWARFVKLYSPLLYSWACHLGLQDADAVDLVQEVFTDLLKQLPTFDYNDHKRFRGWLWTVTRRKWIKKYRRLVVPPARQKSMDSLEAREDEPLEEAEFHQYLIEELIPAQEKNFKPGTWRAFWEHVVEGKPARQVAESLGISEGAVYMAKMRVLARLHKELAHLIGD